MNISWQNSHSHLLMNPAFPHSAKSKFLQILNAAENFPSHIWFATSGSTVQKWVGLSKSALLASAEAVNHHLQSTKEDCWINALPFFHVGGLAIDARVFMSGASVYNFQNDCPGKWSADSFYRYLEEKKGTLSSLVPAQLHDLILMKKIPPSSLRALIIGGGALLPALYEKATALGWPILPTYGSTECASQVASAPLESVHSKNYPALQLLSHISAKTEKGVLFFSGPSLLSTYAFFENEKVKFADPKMDKWLQSDDRGFVNEKELRISGRVDTLIKIGGESVDLALLENLLQHLRLKEGIKEEAVLLAMPDERLGFSIHLASDAQDPAPLFFLAGLFHEKVLPFERIRNFHFVEKLPKSALGKVLKNSLIDMITNINI